MLIDGANNNRITIEYKCDACDNVHDTIFEGTTQRTLAHTFMELDDMMMATDVKSTEIVIYEERNETDGRTDVTRKVLIMHAEKVLDEITRALFG